MIKIRFASLKIPAKIVSKMQNTRLSLKNYANDTAPG
jgi:hypothetical protein